MSSLPNRRTTGAVALEELKRRRDLESLRKYLINEQCFPASKDPMTSVITMEELKKLARIWKLNERRNFWKTHSERNEMVAALIEHAEQNANYLTVSTKNIMKTPSLELTPMPPGEIRSSNAKGVKGFRNYCGKKYFNRENNAQELLLNSRFFDFPEPETNINHVVDVWRTEDFNMRDEQSAANIANRNASLAAQQTHGRASIAKGVSRNKIKMQKLRNLSVHLLNYSANVDLARNPLSLKAVQTFVNVADTDDTKTVSNCTIAISNISANEQVRASLLEINAMHKFTNYLQYIRGASTQWAAALLFYYFSCDKDSEDRVYNACSAFAQMNGLSKEMDTRMVALYTMNNLMPCIDRGRVVELAMKIVMSMFNLDGTAYDKYLTPNCLMVLQNMVCFSNTHTTLVSLNVTGLLAHFATLASVHKLPDLGLGVVKVIHAFLYQSDQASNIITEEFIHVLIILLNIDHEALLVQVLKAAAVISSLPALQEVVRNTSLVENIALMVIGRPQISTNLSNYVVKFLVNVTLGQSEANLERLVNQRVPEAILTILKSSTLSINLKCAAIRALQNILSTKANCIKLADVCLDPLMKILRDVQDIGAAFALYNVACIPECRSGLVEAKVHFKMLDLLNNAKDLQVKSAYLQILVQMSSSNVCVLEMLNLNLISTLETQLKKGQNKDVWEDISTMLLAVVAFAAKDLNEKDQVSIIHILGIICVKGSTDEMIENCANVLKYVSVRYGVFEELNPVVRAMLVLSDSEEVTDSLSTVLYNMTCVGRNVVLMLANEEYVNIMIRIMRSGKLEVQENIAQAMRTLCANERCTSILLKADILSDLIVVALLRTSSEEIKVVCSEAFYNLLCHSDTRLRLLRGDLWWAVMRLCRTDSDHVRRICARTLFDLSCEPQNVQPLREHHVISFIKDISTTGNEEFLTKCLHSAHNLIAQFDAKYPIVTHEIISSVRIGADALSRCTGISNVREALILLLKCSQHDLSIGTDQEFINLDVVEALTSTKGLWGEDEACKLYVSRLLWELSKSGVFTKSCTLHDLDSVLLTVYSPESTDSEITDNISAIFLQFVLREKVPPAQFISLQIWNKLLNEALGTSHSRVPSPIAPSLSGLDGLGSSSKSNQATPRNAGGRQRVSIYRGDSMSVMDAMQTLSFPNQGHHHQGQYLPFATRGGILSILAYSVREHLNSSDVTITRTLVKGILTVELLDNPLTRPNLLKIIHALSEVSELALYMVDCNVFRLLSRYLSNSYGTNKQATAQEYCSTVIRNVSLHPAVFTKLDALDGSIDDLLQEIMDTPNQNVIQDLAYFFFNSSTLLATDSASLSPLFVLSMISKITAVDTAKDSEAAVINKCTISIILNSYPFDTGVDPSFVQSMFLYMQTNPSSTIPESLAVIPFKDNADLQATLMPDFINSRPSYAVALVTTAPDEDQWLPTVSVIARCNHNIILKFTQAQTALYDRLELSDSFAPPSFTKIIKTFERVTASMLDMENIALVEVEDEDKEDDETEDDTTATLQGESSILREKLEKGSLSPEEVAMILSVTQGNQEGEEGGEHSLTEQPSLSGEQAYRHSHGTPTSASSSVAKPMTPQKATEAAAATVAQTQVSSSVEHTTTTEASSAEVLTSTGAVVGDSTH